MILDVHSENNPILFSNWSEKYLELSEYEVLVNIKHKYF